jgi:hypothetical protein
MALYWTGVLVLAWLYFRVDRSVLWNNAWDWLRGFLGGL